MQRPIILRAFRETLHRLRHFRGHGVHSPYVYSIVRSVFMRRGLFEERDEALLAELQAIGVSRRLGVELHNLYRHCGYESFAIDPNSISTQTFVVLTHVPSDEWLESARTSATTVVLLRRRGLSRKRVGEIVAKHPSTSIERRGYTLLLNNHLPKQKFIL